MCYDTKTHLLRDSGILSAYALRATVCYKAHRSAASAVVELTAAGIVIAAAQQNQNPQPRIVIAATAAITIVVTAATQQQNDPNKIVITATTKSTHNKIPP